MQDISWYEHRSSGRDQEIHSFSQTKGEGSEAVAFVLKATSGRAGFFTRVHEGLETSPAACLRSHTSTCLLNAQGRASSASIYSGNDKEVFAASRNP